MPTIRTLLDLSTAHLPEELCADLSAEPGVIASATTYGWLMWVPEHPEHPEEFALATGDPVPEVILGIWRHARALGCDYVLFRNRDKTYYSEPLVIPT